MLFGAVGASPQIGANLGQFGGCLGSQASQHLLRVGADTAQLGAGGVLSFLRAGRLLLGQPGALLGPDRILASLIPPRLCGPDPLLGFRKGPPDR